MDKKIVLTAILVLFISSIVMAAPSITTLDLGSTTSGSAITLDFNILDENAEIDVGSPDQLLISYSNISGTFQNTIYMDTNLMDSTGVQCADDNFFASTRCTYVWVVPSVTPTNYFVDYNFIVQPENVGYKDSTTAFVIENTSGCATLNWAVLIISLGLVFFTLMRLLNEMNPTNATIFAVSVIVGLAIVYTFTSSVCVVT